MTNFLEHSYTSSRAKGGYFTIQYSHGLNEHDIKQLEKNGLYSLPETDRYDPRPEENELTGYPIQFNVYRLKDGRRVFGRSVYRGRDNHSRSARPGNYYSHSLVLNDRSSADKVLACEVYHHASDDIWKKRLEENKLGAEPKDEIVGPVSLTLKGDAAEYIPIIGKLLKKDRDLRLSMLARVMDLLLDGVHKTKRIVIIDEDEVLPTWICTLTLVLPPRLYEDIHFSSFYADPQQGDARVVCSVEDCAALFARSGDAEIIQRNVERTKPRHDFTMALLVLIEEIVDEQNTIAKEKKWRNFMNQIAGVKRLGVELDEEVKYYTEMIGWEQFDLAQFEDILKKHPNKMQETKEKMLSIPLIRMEYFEREINKDRVIDLEAIIPYLNIKNDSGELSKYAHMLADKAGSLAGIESLYPRKDLLSADCKSFIKKRGLELTLKFGEMRKCDEARIDQIERISSEINDKQKVKLEIFRYLCKLKQSKDIDTINNLSKILEKRKELKEEEQSGLEDDIYDFRPAHLPDWLSFLPNKTTEIGDIFNTLDSVLAPPAGTVPDRTNAAMVLLHYLKGDFENESVNQKFQGLPGLLKREVLEKINNKKHRSIVDKQIYWPFAYRHLSTSFEAKKFITYLSFHSINSQKEFTELFFATLQEEPKKTSNYAELLLNDEFFTWERHKDIITYLFSLIPKPDKIILKKYPEYIELSFSKEESGAARLSWLGRILGSLKKKDQESEISDLVTFLEHYSPESNEPSWTWIYLEVLVATAIKNESSIFSALIRHFLRDKRYKKDNYDKKYCCIYLKSIREFSDTKSFIIEHGDIIDAIFDEKKWTKIDSSYKKTEILLKRKSAKKSKPGSLDTQNNFF